VTATLTASARDGTPLAYTLDGSAEAALRLVCIHSLALDREVWRPVAEVLGDEAAVLRYDCRGAGHSGKPAGPYSVEQFADDLVDLLDAVAWDRAVVAGCSMGGCVAQAFAAAYPDRVEGLVLVDTTDWYGEDAPRTWRERAATARRDGLAGMATFQITRWFGDAFRQEHPALIDRIMATFAGNDLNAYAATCAMLGDADLRGRLAEPGFPVAIVVGKEDYATPLTAAEALRGRINGATLDVIPAARHLTPIEAPDRIAAAIRTVTPRREAAT
jgi:3-oxoadipate enol-lactonase